MIVNPTQFVSNKTTADEVVKVLTAGANGLVQFFGELKSSDIKSFKVNAAVAGTASTATFPAAKLLVAGAFELSLCVDFHNPKVSSSAKSNNIDFSKIYKFPIHNKSSVEISTLVANLNDAAKRTGASEYVTFSVSSSNVVITLSKKELGDTIEANIKDVHIVDLNNAVTASVIPSPVYLDVAVSYTACVPAYGTYGYLTKHLKFPTEANTDFLSEPMDCKPVRGAKYSQLIINTRMDRGPIGNSKFGENITSDITWILWFPSSLESAVTKNITDIKTAPVEGLSEK